jgi:hypothetical protein
LANTPQKIVESPNNLTDIDEDIANCNTLTTCFPICPSQASFTAIPDVTEQSYIVILTPDYPSTSSTFVPVVAEEIATDFIHNSSSSNIIPNDAEKTIIQICLDNPSTSSTDVLHVAETTVHIYPDDTTIDPVCGPLSVFTNVKPMEPTQDYPSTSSTFVPVIAEEITTDFAHISPSSSSTIIPNAIEETALQSLDNPSTSSTDALIVAQQTIVRHSPNDSTTDSDYVP